MDDVGFGKGLIEYFNIPEAVGYAFLILGFVVFAVVVAAIRVAVGEIMDRFNRRSKEKNKTASLDTND